MQEIAYFYFIFICYHIATKNPAQWVLDGMTIISASSSELAQARDCQAGIVLVIYPSKGLGRLA